MPSLRTLAASLFVTAAVAADSWTGTGQIGVQKEPYGYMGCLNVDGQWIILKEGGPDLCAEFTVTSVNDGTFTLASTENTPCVVADGAVACAEGLTATKLSADGALLKNPDADGTTFYTEKNLPVGSITSIEILTESAQYEVSLQWYGQ